MSTPPDSHSLIGLSFKLRKLIETKLWAKILLSMGLGILVGMGLGPTAGWVDVKVSQTLTSWMALPGHLFLAIIQMVVIPLVFSSVAQSLGTQKNLEQLKRFGWKASLYFLTTTTVAICIGIGIALFLKPGKYVQPELIQQAFGNSQAGNAQPLSPQGMNEPSSSSFPEGIVNLLPGNPLGSMVEGEMLQVVVFAIFFGIALLVISKKQAKPLIEVLGSLQTVCMTIVQWAMRLAPLAVFGLMVQLSSQLGIDVLLGLLVYVGTVLLGLVLLVVFYLLIIKFFAKGQPFRFLGQSKEVLLLAFSTSSSAAVMPLSMKTANEKLHVSRAVSEFLIPLGATINMDGTALYQGVATVFLAQVFGVELSVASLLLVVVTSVTSSIGAPATPGVGIVILASILEGAGIPASGIALILGVDRALDMSRTSVNVTGDLTACMVIDRIEHDRFVETAPVASISSSS